MEESIYSRTEMMLGADRVERLKQSRVAVFGLGGVGGMVAEALCRGGVGALDLYDHDTVSVTNLNRQIIATLDTVGKLKTEALRERLSRINPECRVILHPVFYNAETDHSLSFEELDYICDAIDTVSSKLLLIQRAKKENIPIISAMGAGNKLDPSRFEVDDIYNTSVCPLARVMRKELKAMGIPSLTVVYSQEPPVKLPGGAPEENGRHTPGSLSFVPSAAGLVMAGKVIRDLAGIS
ncbi:MAG: tRNA threonylcarbamoyladenosine dehydratase [Ruminococcaceae bacterium]|nr:tRNA threonylcarbamoyladenosine dehydratase [Oscillospiraceae bacterium]